MRGDTERIVPSKYNNNNDPILLTEEKKTMSKAILSQRYNVLKTTLLLLGEIHRNQFLPLLLFLLYYYSSLPLSLFRWKRNSPVMVVAVRPSVFSSPKLSPSKINIYVIESERERERQESQGNLLHVYT